MERIWTRFLTDQDKRVIEAAGFGALAGFGARPALIIVDVTYGFTGDRPQPILDSIRRWSHSCGEVSWPAIARIGTLAEAFRAKRLPVIYTAGEARADNWDAGSWAWKNIRTTETAARPAVLPDPNDIVAEIAPQAQDVVIRKLKPSGFFGTNLLSFLVLLGCDSIVLTGTTTSGCVRATAVDAFSNNLRVAVAEDGCFDRAEVSHAVSLFDMHAKYADVVPSSAILEHVASLRDDLFPGLPSGAGVGEQGVTLRRAPRARA